MDLIDQIAAYTPFNDQEAADKPKLLRLLQTEENIFTRDNTTAHMTASGWVVSPDRASVLMIYHNIYNSWSWMGGHADGETNLLQVAQREIQEESGVKGLKLLTPDIFSLEILTVDGHIKRGQYVSSHLHLNVTYLFEADPEELLRVKPDENSGVAWIPIPELPNKVTEAWFLERIYSKLCRKLLDTGL
ncbi:MAG: NUDIX hydrolase [Candidatus Faecousia sp.]|nr:NUDIX hydrolase [Clostridiales bacterium]MDY6179860.1 NUDIX hydrolase [Candidatus Faecousia sp.]